MKNHWKRESSWKNFIVFTKLMTQGVRDPTEIFYQGRKEKVKETKLKLKENSDAKVHSRNM